MTTGSEESGNPFTPEARFCRQCGAPRVPAGRFCAKCGQAWPAPTEAPSPLPGRSGRGRCACALALLAGLILVCGLGLYLGWSRWQATPSNPEQQVDPWERVGRRRLLDEVVAPSPQPCRVRVGEGLTLTVSPGALEAPERLTVDSLQRFPDLALGVPARSLACYEIRFERSRVFAEPLYLELAYQPENLGSSLPPEFALVAHYWDEELEQWVEMASFVDSDRKILVVPTFHLTRIRFDAVQADGHIYNDFFSLKYETAELAALQKKRPDYAAIYAASPQAAWDALNQAREAYDRAGFRKLEKIRALETRVERGFYRAGSTALPTDRVTTRRYNVYLGNGGLVSSTHRRKASGNIHIPYADYGVDELEVAHEVFHSIQNRYYSALGMSDLGVPGTVTPRLRLLARSWWLEGTAEYAAGKIAVPQADGRPNRRMGGDLDGSTLRRSLLQSPSVLRDLVTGSDSGRQGYNNAWFFEFLAVEKGVDFCAMFEGVAASWRPDVYTTMVEWLKGRGLEMDQVYTEFTRWWLYAPRSPASGVASGGLAGTTLDGTSVKKKGQNLRIHLDFPAMEGKHRARVWKLGVEAEAGRETDPRALIVTMSDPLVSNPRLGPTPGWWHGVETWTSPVQRSAWVDRPTPGGGSPVASRALSRKRPVVVQPLLPGELLYLRAVSNDDNTLRRAAFLVSEARLEVQPEAIQGGAVEETHNLILTIRDVPAALVPGLQVQWRLGERLLATSTPQSPAGSRDVLQAVLKVRRFPRGSHTLRVRLLTREGVVLGTQAVPIEMAPQECRGQTFQAIVTNPGYGPSGRLREYGFVLMEPGEMATRAAAVKGSPLTPRETEDFVADVLRQTLSEPEDRQALARVLPAACYTKVESGQLLVMYHGDYKRYKPDGTVRLHYRFDHGFNRQTLHESTDSAPVGTNPMAAPRPRR